MTTFNELNLQLNNPYSAPSQPNGWNPMRPTGNTSFQRGASKVVGLIQKITGNKSRSVINEDLKSAIAAYKAGDKATAQMYLKKVGGFGEGNDMMASLEAAAGLSNPAGYLLGKALNPTSSINILGDKINNGGFQWDGSAPAAADTSSSPSGMFGGTPLTFGGIGKTQTPTYSPSYGGLSKAFESTATPIQDLDMQGDIANTIAGMDTSLTVPSDSSRTGAGSVPVRPTYSNQWTQGGRINALDVAQAQNSSPVILNPGDKALENHNNHVAKMEALRFASPGMSQDEFDSQQTAAFQASRMLK